MTCGRLWNGGRAAAKLIVLALLATGFTIASSVDASFPGTNGRIAYVQGQPGNIFVVDPSNPVPAQITNTANYLSVAFDATGTKLVASNNAGIVLLDPTPGSAATLVPNTTGADRNPEFDPSGTKLVFNNGNTLFTIDTAGTNRTSIFNDGARPQWSADGTFIAFHDNTPTAGNAIRRIDPNGANLITLATTGPGGTACGAGNPCFAPTVSPDSSKVIFAQVGPANGGLAQVNANGTTVQPVRITTSATDDNPSYAPAGDKVAFTRGAGQALNTVPTDGSGTASPVTGVANVFDTSWGRSGTTPPPGGTTFSIAGPVGKVKSGPCVFTITASAPATGSVNFTTAVVSGKNTPNPASGSVAFANQTSNTLSIAVKHSRKKKGDVSVTLTSATGGTVGAPATATCDVGKKK